ncbi:unnamed protein product [Cochlearia groenlandica]
MLAEVMKDSSRSRCFIKTYGCLVLFPLREFGYQTILQALSQADLGSLPFDKPEVIWINRVNEILDSSRFLKLIRVGNHGSQLLTFGLPKIIIPNKPWKRQVALDLKRPSIQDWVWIWNEYLWIWIQHVLVTQERMANHGSYPWIFVSKQKKRKRKDLGFNKPRLLIRAKRQGRERDLGLDLISIQTKAWGAWRRQDRDLSLSETTFGFVPNRDGPRGFRAVRGERVQHRALNVLLSGAEYTCRCPSRS